MPAWTRVGEEATLRHTMRHMLVSMNMALTIAAEGGKADIAKPLRGLGVGRDGDRGASPNGRLAGCLRYRDRRKAVSAACLSEEIQNGRPDPENGDRPRPGASRAIAEGTAAMKDENIELVEGSGNVFRDFGDPEADLKQAKAVLAARVIAVLDERGFSVRKAASVTGFAAADFSRVRNADLGRFTLDRLMKMVAALDDRVRVTVHVGSREASRAVMAK